MHEIYFITIVSSLYLFYHTVGSEESPRYLNRDESEKFEFSLKWIK